MGARGPHDDFETAAKLIRAAYAEFALTQDLESLRRKYIADDLESVTRHGTFHGSDHFMSELEANSKNWTLEGVVEDIVDAGEGALIVFVKFLRKEKDTGKVAWKAWPAIVMRIHEGKMVFNEGYIDRRKALADLGVEQG
jgi:hypothetical protein